jgi:hypothetical protein
MEVSRNNPPIVLGFRIENRESDYQTQTGQFRSIERESQGVGNRIDRLAIETISPRLDPHECRFCRDKDDRATGPA